MLITGSTVNRTCFNPAIFYGDSIIKEHIFYFNLKGTIKMHQDSRNGFIPTFNDTLLTKRSQKKSMIFYSIIVLRKVIKRNN